jgi:hypothetical protein
MRGRECPQTERRRCDRHFYRVHDLLQNVGVTHLSRQWLTIELRRTCLHLTDNCKAELWSEKAVPASAAAVPATTREL